MLKYWLYCLKENIIQAWLKFSLLYQKEVLNNILSLSHSHTNTPRHPHAYISFTSIWQMWAMYHFSSPLFYKLAYKHSEWITRKTFWGKYHNWRVYIRKKIYRKWIIMSKDLCIWPNSAKFWNSEGLSSSTHEGKSYIPWQWTESSTLLFLKELSACECTP